MNTDDRPPDADQRRNDLAETVARKEQRKLRARKSGRSPWYGLSLMGLIGWTVAIPTLLGIALGLWLDARWPGPISWVLTFLLLGIAVGAAMAWFWIERERRGD